MKKDIYKEIAKEVINTEIVSLNKLKNSLDVNFRKAVEKILNCSGPEKENQTVQVQRPKILIF